MRNILGRTKAPKNVEYQSFINILNEHDVPYCIDSGVLLALMREGKLFENEKDVDIQMWAEHENKLYSLLPLFKDRGYKVTIWLYKGLTYQYRFLHPYKIPVHIMLFRRKGNWAWCPASKATGNPFKTLPGRYLYYGFNGFRRRIRQYLVTTDISIWPWNMQRIVATWRVPAMYFDQTFFHEDFKVYIPHQWDEYLQFRYGNWRVPAEKWDFWHEDGAIIHQNPDYFMDE